MVNKDNLPEGTEFLKKGGVNSISRNKIRETEPAYFLAAKILISRGVNALAFGVERQANPEKSPLYNAVLAHDGVNLGEGKTQAHSPEKAYAAVKEAEVMKNVAMKSFVSRGLGD